ncbi:hypothetical protein ROZALSC1DRAFT_27222, partial [Rozella allomycis CSF55]
FGIALWVWIDANVNMKGIYFGHWIPGIISTIGLILINALSLDVLNDDGFSSYDSTTRNARIFCLIITMLLILGGLISSVWIMIVEFQNKNNAAPGTALIVENVLITLSALIMKFGRKNDEF